MKTGIIEKWGQGGQRQRNEKKKIRIKLQADEKRWRDEKLLGSTAKLLFSLDMTKPEK